MGEGIEAVDWVDENTRGVDSLRTAELVEKYGPLAQAALLYGFSRIALFALDKFSPPRPS